MKRITEHPNYYESKGKAHGWRGGQPPLTPGTEPGLPEKETWAMSHDPFLEPRKIKKITESIRFSSSAEVDAIFDASAVNIGLIFLIAVAINQSPWTLSSTSELQHSCFSKFLPVATKPNKLWCCPHLCKPTFYFVAFMFANTTPQCVKQCWSHLFIQIFIFFDPMTHLLPSDYSSSSTRRWVVYTHASSIKNQTMELWGYEALRLWGPGFTDLRI